MQACCPALLMSLFDMTSFAIWNRGQRRFCQVWFDESENETFLSMDAAPVGLNTVSVPSATSAIFQKISRWFGRENPNSADVVIPFVQKRQDQQHLRCQFVRGFVSFSSVSLCYRASLPTVTLLDKLCWFSAFFSIMQLTFPAFLVLLEGNAIFPLRSLACAWTKCVNYRFVLVLSPPMTHTVSLGIGKYDSSCLGYDICLGLRIAVLKVEQRCNFPKV